MSDDYEFGLLRGMFWVVVGWLVVILIIAGVVLTIGGLAWRGWAMWRSSQVKEATK